MRPSLVPSFKPLITLMLVLAAANASGNPAAELRQPAIFHAEGEARLELASGEQVAPRLPAGVEPINTAALGDHGWVVTALREQEIVILMSEGGRGAAAALP